MRKIIVSVVLVLFSVALKAASKDYTLKSPNGKLSCEVSVADIISYRIALNDKEVLSPSAISVDIVDGQDFGVSSKLQKSKTNSENAIIETPVYKKSQVVDNYNELRLSFKEDFAVVFRAYNEAISYRFVYTGKSPIKIKNEQVEFNFAKDYKAFVPYVRSKSTDFEKQYFNSFENLYTYTSLTELDSQKLMFSPLTVEQDNGVKVSLAESDVEHYPGMFLLGENGKATMRGHFAPYPKEVRHGGYNNLQEVVDSREDYIAKFDGQSNFPWRIIIVTENDTQLADNDVVYKLAAANRIGDTSWIKPGKVAWEWWNNWGLSGVDFRTGVNNDTYKAYINFASKNDIEYVILDEGWAVHRQADLFQVVPEIDLEHLVSYAKEKNVGIILWAGYYAFARDIEGICKHYSEMGVKGFKIDFMERDDQPMVEFHYDAATIAAKYKMLIDFHGSYKPTGLQRTYPNVINFEGVHGQEQAKWNDITFDQVTYDVTMPFIRMLAGPVDYTQGAMRNGTKDTFRAVTKEPMSMGTRCRQLAEYVVFESPLNMLCDSPTKYEQEQECTDFIAAVPTVWDETVALKGKVGSYIAIARRKGQSWYVGAMTGWTAMDMEIDLSFLGDGNYKAEIFRDGINADKIGTDYVKEIQDVPSDKKLKVKLASGGGCAIRIY